jgi:adenosylmethionine-8-amino-7-oxononanoate aminotransferase
MNGLTILGTDTGAGKTTLALLWMAAFGDEFDYWKPLETGDRDSETVRRLVPDVRVHPPVMWFREAVAPLAAARHENRLVPGAADLAKAAPRVDKRSLLVETFGGPLSPLNEQELQLVLVKALALPTILVSSSTVGAIGRCLQSLAALRVEGLEPAGVVLVGPEDPFAVEQIERWWIAGRVWNVPAPTQWTAEGIRIFADASREKLRTLRALLVEAEVSQTIPSDRTLVARDRQNVWHPYTSLGTNEPPLECVGAQNEFLHLADGRKVIDAISSWWTILHGHRQPLLMAALEQASHQFDHVHFAGVTHEPAVALAELILATMPWHGGRVFYSDDGSTAVEVALKLAHQFWRHRGEPQRTHFIGFEHGYHGDTFGAMAVSRDPVFFGAFEPMLFGASIVPLSPQRLEEELSRRPGQTAAIIVEPLVQGAGGMRMHTPGQLQAIAEVAHRHDVPLIADEVMTGGGRTGTLWAYQAAGIIPDLICMGKTLAGGILPLAATAVSPRIVEAFQTTDRRKTFFHGHSFTAHPLACAVAVANWKHLLPSVTTKPIEAIWRETLLSLQELPQVREVRIRGSIAAVEIEGEGEGEAGYLAEAGSVMRKACLDRGVLCRPLGNVLYALPPLATPPASLYKIAQAIREAVAAVGKAK